MIYALEEDGETPVRVTFDRIQEIDWEFVEKNKRIAKDTINGLDGSTVFLSTDHSFGGGAPVLWETMVFVKGTVNEIFCDRYTSREDAVVGHKAALAKIASGEIHSG